MYDGPEENQFQPRLPPDRAYWDDLEERILDAVEPILCEHREAQVWWRPLARWSPAIGVAAAVAALLAAVIVPTTDERPQQVSFAQLISPDDPIAQAVVARAAVTEISAMLLVESGGQR